MTRVQNREEHPTTSTLPYSREPQMMSIAGTPGATSGPVDRPPGDARIARSQGDYVVSVDPEVEENRGASGRFP